jgi:hypothetical protein
MMAGATTGIAGILHLVLALNGISRSLPAFTIFFIVAGTAKVILGNITHKTMGKNLVLYGNRRYNCFDDSLCTNKATKSNYRGKSINNQWTTELFQAAFIIIPALILMKQRTVHPSQREQLR